MTDIVGPALSDALGGIGTEAALQGVRIATRLGRELLQYNLSRSSAAAPTLESDSSSAFVIIGLGRCGCRVTARLAQMIDEARSLPRKRPLSLPTALISTIRNVILKDDSILRLEPIMIIGDLNEATYAEVEGLLSQSKGLNERTPFMRIDYRPLAPNGCGNIPVFGEFFTRALLALPVTVDEFDRQPWEMARNYLLDLCDQNLTPTRIAFYIFSAAGGSGAGSAAEVLRAQRFALSRRRSSLAPMMYFTGIAVIPEDQNRNLSQLRNTGRTIVQYLADLDIKLDSPADYASEQVCRYATKVEYNDGSPATDLQPWDSLGIISNEIMYVHADGATHVEAERSANQYISQQVFNLAAAQSPPTEFRTSAGGRSPSHLKQDLPTNSVVFEALHLDTEDLRAGLRGPYSVAFAASSRERAPTIEDVDAMFVRAISPPTMNPLKQPGGGLIEGISVLPQRKDKYLTLLQPLHDAVKGKVGGLGKPLLEPTMFDGLQRLPMFRHCPRVVFVLTSPVDRNLSHEAAQRVATLVSWLTPSLRQPRFAIIPGTTAYFSVSIYIESSVVLSYDVEKAIMNYLRDCWAARNDPAATFTERYRAILQQDAPITDAQVAAWLGNEEQYGANVVDFEKMAASHDERWQRAVDKCRADEQEKAELRRHRVKNCLLTPAEVAAAIRFINYVKHMKPRDPLEPPEETDP